MSAPSFKDPPVAVDLGDGVLYLREPNAADLIAMESVTNQLEASCTLIARLLVEKDGTPLFIGDQGAEIVQSWPLRVITAITSADVFAGLQALDPVGEAKKNSSAPDSSSSDSFSLTDGVAAIRSNSSARSA